MSYTVLARRYRSQSFDEVVGQDAVSRTLKNALTSDRVAHAYLFTGDQGSGQDYHGQGFGQGSELPQFGQAHQRALLQMRKLPGY